MALTTLLQSRLAETILDPKVRSKTEAMEKAGYSPVTARASAKRALESAGTKHAIAVAKSDRSDKARAILAKASLRTSAELDDQRCDPDYALKAMVAAAAVIEKVPEEETDDHEHVDKVLELKRRAFAVGVRWGLSRNKRPNTSTFASETAIDNQGESLQVIDAVAVDSDNG